MSAITDKKTIIDFLSGDGTDHKGRYYHDTLEWSDVQLEQCHDQVQWIFPLHEDSHMARTWPVVNKEIVEEAKLKGTVIINLNKAADRFEKFLGIGKYSNHARQNLWCRPNNHNLLRVTRIIRSLRLFGLQKRAEEFYHAAMKAQARCGVWEDTRTYWHKAMYEDVWDSLR